MFQRVYRIIFTIGAVFISFPFLSSFSFQIDKWVEGIKYRALVRKALKERLVVR